MRAQTALAVLALTVAVTPAAAQDGGDDWTLIERDGIVMASVAYASGPALAVRCLPGNALQVILAGLPAAAEDEFTRSLEVSQPGGDLAASTWVVAEDRTTAFAMTPSRTARTFRSTPRFTVRAPTADGRHARLELDLPGATSALDRALQACDRPLVDAVDLKVLPTGASSPIDWAEVPQVNYPDRAEANGVLRGVVAMDCGVQQNGRLEACRVEAEFPYAMGFGPQALRAVRDARLTRDSARDLEGRARFTINFRLQ